MFSSTRTKEHRPLIIVTGPDKWLKFAWWATRFQLWRAGAKALYASPKNALIVDGFDGVIIGGGNDINPKHYGATGAAGARYDEARDELELATIKMAMQAQLPILGICRGAQLLNVARGGNLIGDLRPLRRLTPNRNSLFPIKRATIRSSSRLAKALRNESLMVNSLHHQAVDRLGYSLSAVAHDDDMFVQAIEGTEDEFVIGVQWHPEYLIFQSAQLKLFKALITAAKTKSDKTT